MKPATVPSNGTPVVAANVTPEAVSAKPSGGENSEVVPAASVAVAVMIGTPGNGVYGTLKTASPATLVVDGRREQVVATLGPRRPRRHSVRLT